MNAHPKLLLAVLALSLLGPACGGPSSAGERRAPYEVERVTPRPRARGPRILGVVAHPDDEIAFGATMYKVSTALDGVADVAVITNGEGGFRYATLAERVYGKPLTEERVGRAELPAIRRAEMVAGCRWLAVRDVYFLDQQDHRYTQDALEVLGPEAGVWDLDGVRGALADILANGYDFVLTLAPTATTHGHHKAATVLALEAAAALPEDERPVVLCARTSRAEEPAPEFTLLEGFPSTRLTTRPWLVFDRLENFGHRERLHYGIVVNWAIAEHKSQGTMQLLAGVGEREHFALFTMNPPDAELRARRLFQDLARPAFGAGGSGAEDAGD